MKKFSIIILLVSLSILSFAKSKGNPTEIKGQVIEIVDGIEQPVAMAFIYIDNSIYTAYTDNQGNFSLDIPKGTHEVKVSFKGYEEESQTINTKKDNLLTFKLKGYEFASK